MNKSNSYYGRIPACCVFCSGYPTYTREKNRVQEQTKILKDVRNAKPSISVARKKELPIASIAMNSLAGASGISLGDGKNNGRISLRIKDF